jgi:hypothetical protein
MDLDSWSKISLIFLYSTLTTFMNNLVQDLFQKHFFYGFKFILKMTTIKM